MIGNATVGGTFGVTGATTTSTLNVTSNDGAAFPGPYYARYLDNTLTADTTFPYPSRSVLIGKNTTNGNAWAVGYRHYQDGDALQANGVVVQSTAGTSTDKQFIFTNAGFECRNMLGGVRGQLRFENVELRNKLRLNGVGAALPNGELSSTISVSMDGAVAGTLTLYSNLTNVMGTWTAAGITVTGTGTSAFAGSATFAGTVSVAGTATLAGVSATTVAATGNVTTNTDVAAKGKAIIGDTATSNYVTITPGVRKDVATTGYIQHEIPGTGTHFFWDNIEVDGTCSATRVLIGDSPSTLFITTDGVSVDFNTGTTSIPYLFDVGGSNRLTISSSGVVAAGVSYYSPISYAFGTPTAITAAINKSVSDLRITNNDNTSILFQTGTTLVTRATVFNNGNFTISGGVGTKSTGISWANPSDIRLKRVTGEYCKGLAEINRVRPIKYRFKGNSPSAPDDLEEHVGVVAQELQLVVPECVKVYRDTLEGEPTDLLKVDASDLTWMLVNAVKELSARVVQLESQECSRCKRKRAL